MLRYTEKRSTEKWSAWKKNPPKNGLLEKMSLEKWSPRKKSPEKWSPKNGPLDKKSPEKWCLGKWSLEKIPSKIVCVKRMLGNLNRFFIFNNCCHYTHKKMFDVHLTILHVPNCRTIKAFRKVCCRVLGFHKLITSQHSTHTAQCSTLTPWFFVCFQVLGLLFFPIFRRFCSQRPFFRGFFFQGTIFPGTIFSGFNANLMLSTSLLWLIFF